MRVSDRFEFAANAGRHFGLHVEAVDLGEAAGKENVDAGFGFGRSVLRCFRAEGVDMIHAETHEADGSGL